MIKRRVRITNDADYPFELTAFDAVTGEKIPRIRSISIASEANCAVRATICTILPLVNFTADAEVRDLVWVEQADGSLANLVSGEIRHFKD